ncbi:sodium-independent sulfate anion transporter-like isoform X4 [Eriocheir sinensis]|nr:sodium-independent sulfate anion transporter-like isoform X4 [Eriocheir sinensis]XP_050734430.1 sodium-independent sulfate anion transporter-like isoform X4 [Eriocheir sinensis]XP_050734431.1 sodium-independent sulfate anion transporter-like isoform X4 [Eriocheir sinensis]XP_050734432.1 sodium-independent sulfate anion transporter-like isoform X4 [Eriocheir sinensis]XP_050734433.1 sodium-independent sulfate anion transporter-like isoform X4 [Eriocheir sinensis]XP_050734434.1 sodium-independ
MSLNYNTVSELLKARARKFFSRKTLNQRIPITQWLPKYDLECLEGDMMAGLTVGLTVIPQGIAYAGIASLPPNYGLYSAFMGCFVYMFLGSSKDITIGPTAIMSIMTHQYSVNGNPDYAILLCFLSGLIIFASGLCNMGFLITFISKPVISGFTSAAAISIASSQLKSLFGLSYDSETVIEDWSELFKNIGYSRWQDLTLGLCCMVVLLLMRKIKDLRAAKPQAGDSSGMRIARKALFLTSVGRNALIVIVAAIIAFAAGHDIFTLTGEIEAGLPEFKPPPFSTHGDNGTYVGFSDMIANVGSGVIIIPLISILESIAIASAFSGGKTIDATQEMYALGMCNIIGSFVQSMPVTGSFSRTAVNSTSGVKTPAGGIATGLLVVLALAFLTPYFKYIPKATLAAVIICAVIFMVEYEIVKPIWKAQRLDQLPLWGTFFTCLFWKLEFGILVGVGINLLILLYGIARPKVSVSTVLREEGNEPQYVVVEPRSGLFFPSVDHVRNQVSKASMGPAQGSVMVVMDCSHFTGVDYSAVKGMKSLCNDFEKRHQPLIFTNVTPGVQRGLCSLIDNIVIAQSPDQFEAAYKNSSATSTLNHHREDGAMGGVSRHGEDPESLDPLLQSATGPRPVVVVCNS